MGKSIKDLFFVSEEQTKGAPQVAETSQVKKEVFTTKSTPVVAPEPSDAKTTVDVVSVSEEMVSQIWEEIVKRNLPGPDYLELRNNASALEGLPLTEEQRLEAAFKVLKKTYPNLSKDIIVRSIDTYVGIVEEERKKGLDQCNQVRTNTVGEKKSRLELMKTTAKDTLAQIEELKKRYEEVNANINQMEHDILSATQELDAKERAFNASIDSALGVLNSDKSKILTLNF